jgi:membrane associated rhomboid family serine protease
VFTFLLVISVLAAVGYRITTPAERLLLAHKLTPAIAAVERWLSDSAAFRATLRARTHWLVVTPALVTITIIVFARMLWADGTLSEPTLVEWGATQGTRTASGEWWRLVSATFVHDGPLGLLATLVVLLQLGALLERFVGPLTVGCAYLAAGALDSTIRMSSDVTDVSCGGAGAVVGLYGVLLAAWVWGRLCGATVNIPPAQFKLLALAAPLVVLSSFAAYGPDPGHALACFAVGLIIGLAGAMKASHMKVTFVPVAWATTIALVAIVYVAMPIQSLTRVRQQIAQLVVIEDETAEKYRKVLRRFTDNRMRIDTQTLTRVIDGSIVPELTRAATDLSALEQVLPEHQPLVASALEYLKLRETSWRLRAEGLRRGNMRLLQQADNTEQASMAALRPFKDFRAEASN